MLPLMSSKYMMREGRGGGGGGRRRKKNFCRRRDFDVSLLVALIPCKIREFDIFHLALI
jgi:hypothetical protein